MSLLRLQIDDFRCFESVDLALDRRYNLFVGPNASGKTSVLEALFVLGRGRSFRTRQLDRLVRQGQTGFRIVGWCEREGRLTVLGVGGDRNHTELRVGGAPADGAAALASHFPPQIIGPEIHKLLEEGPNRRRRFLDWGVFHVEQGFLDTWQRFHRVLRQRNAGLRLSSDPEAAGAWDREFIAAGERLAGLRQHYLQLLTPALTDVGRRLLDLDVSLVYHRGWGEDEPLADALARSLSRDLKYGVSHVGPHRADVTIRADGLAARERVSRGQQKLLAAALTLAQLTIQESESEGVCALLLDDPAAELDRVSLERLLRAVHELPVQLFVTALQPDLPGLGVPGALFHVERGRITLSG
jgi:DNA replication and repair protein RecF